MDHKLISALMAGLAPVIRDFIVEETKSIAKRVGDLEAREPLKGEPGKSITIDDVRPMLAEIVASLPKPEDGKSVTIDDIRPVIESAVADMPPARDGKSVTIDDVAPLIADEVSKAVAALPAPEPGKDADPAAISTMVADAFAAVPKPQDGKSVTIEDVAPLIADAVASAVAKLPPAPPGKDADPAAMAAMVQQAVAALPAPLPGKSVTVDDVAPLITSEIAKAVAGLPVPKDPVALASAVIDRDGCLALTMSDGSVRQLGRVVGKDVEMAIVLDAVRSEVDKFPRPQDGIGFDDLSIEFDGERTATIKFVRGDVVKEYPLVFPTVIDRGVWREGTFQKGDGVTWGGSFFIAQRETTAKPETQDCGWRLAVKRGRDAKSAVAPPPSPAKVTVPGAAREASRGA